MGCFIISRSCIFIGTGDWVIDPSQDYDVSMSYGLKLIVDLLLVIAVIIPAAQYPFQSWLIESVVAPTPVLQLCMLVL